MCTFWAVVSTHLIQSTCRRHPLDTTTTVWSSSLALMTFLWQTQQALTYVCHQHLSKMLSLCSRIGAPIKTEKVKGLTTCLTFLGIVLDTVTVEASISSECKASLLTAICSFCSLRKCTKWELLSIIGKLSFACKVIPARCIFLCRLIDLSSSVSKLYHHIHLTNEACLDLLWWSDFLPSWSGTSMILDSKWTFSSAMQLFTDASRSKGWGAYWANHWVLAKWSPEQVM